METYDVTVWDKREGKTPEDWDIESPPVRVRALDSHSAAQIVARRTDPGTKLIGFTRPAGSGDIFFEDKDMGLIFQVHDTDIERPHWEKRAI